ncbi:MAG: hypothetical protein JWO45_1605, partial [Spartobacteria bacterium]|nr:hypothetical protein [Spartobacteria bacterium]
EGKAELHSSTAKLPREPYSFSQLSAMRSMGGLLSQPATIMTKNSSTTEPPIIRMIFTAAPN